MRFEALIIVFCLLLSGCYTKTPAPAPTETIPDLCCGGERSSQPINPVPGISSANLGDNAQGPEIGHRFVVKNTSETEVTRFTKEPQVNYPCCMTAVLEVDELGPGEEATLTISYKTRTRPGPFDLFVRLFPEGGEVVEQYHLTGSVANSFVIKPKQLNLATQKTGQFKVYGEQLDESYKITEVKANSPHLKVELLEKTEAGLLYQVTWDGEPVSQEVPVVYVMTDSETFGWAPVLIKGL